MPGFVVEFQHMNIPTSIARIISARQLPSVIFPQEIPVNLYQFSHTELMHLFAYTQDVIKSIFFMKCIRKLAVNTCN